MQEPKSTQLHKKIPWAFIFIAHRHTVTKETTLIATGYVLARADHDFKWHYVLQWELNSSRHSSTNVLQHNNTEANVFTFCFALKTPFRCCVSVCTHQQYQLAHNEGDRCQQQTLIDYQRIDYQCQTHCHCLRKKQGGANLLERRLKTQRRPYKT